MLATHGPTRGDAMRSVARRSAGAVSGARVVGPAPVVAGCAPASSMDGDGPPPVVAATPPRAPAGGPPADTDQRVRVRPHLRDEDEVALGVSRHRVRVLRLRYFLDQDAVRTDHAERGPTGITSPRWSWTAARLSARSARTQVVTVIALVEPDLIRAGDAADGGGVLG